MNVEVEMLPSNTLEVEVGSSSPPREYETSNKSLLLETIPGELHTETTACRLLEAEVVGRCQEESNETVKTKTILESECWKKNIESAGSSRSVNNGSRQSFSKVSASLQSLVRRKSRKYGATSLPLDVDISTYSAHPSCLLEAPRENGVVDIYKRNGEETTCITTRTSTLIYASSVQLYSRGDNNVQDVSSSTNNVAIVTTTTSTNNVTCSVSGSRLGNTASSLIRTTSVITAGPSTSSWNNSAEEELDYVVDPVQGNAYYKGQLLGKSLMHVLKYRGKVTEPEARYYMKQMVTGVAYIHSQKVVHRDLKPGNMFLSDRMIVKIGDFGLATRLDGQCRRVTICGTPNYIAPEVLYKQAYSYEADVWALGCILYALLVGQPPFDTASLKETYARICNNHYREVDDSIASRNGQDLIRWLLQPNPELRPSLERVKEHAYLTKEYVPTSLPRISCFQMPRTSIIDSSPSSNSITSRNQKLNNTQLQVHTIQQSQQHQDQRHTQQHYHQTNLSQKNLRKGSKVISWLARKFRKVPQFRQRLNSVLCPDHKKTGYTTQSMQMHQALESCVTEIKCRNKLRNHPPVRDVVPLFITKWIDYSNKYGLGFQLSDKSVGILFNDHTKISYTHDRRRVEYVTTDDEVTKYHREEDVPAALQKKLVLLQRFTQYMDKFMTEGGEIKKQRVASKHSKNVCVPRMRRWLRTDKTIMMELSVPLLQVNFFEDHTKLVVSQESSNKGHLITYIDTSRRTSSYWLNDIRDFGCTADLYERLYYVYKVSKEFAEMHNNTIA
ncbi:serine/threonine-protein kinase PLK1-like isoform X3 [Bombus huntii]|uniref:serine/threonine-protein kinase PLK1-like isoform X3 n=1 Tax=Bombus huntii TaxID=85661 RepID=UPI0021AA6527|nr:serine/threonine-protein kinase PLK1-like isoform X3 [Bombus huntii]